MTEHIKRGTAADLMACAHLERKYGSCATAERFEAGAEHIKKLEHRVKELEQLAGRLGILLTEANYILANNELAGDKAAGRLLLKIYQELYGTDPRHGGKIYAYQYASDGEPGPGTPAVQDCGENPPG